MTQPHSRAGIALRRRACTGALGAWALSSLVGCGALQPSGPPLQFFVIDDLAADTPTPAEPLIGRTVVLAAGPSPTLFTSQRMVFTRDGVSHAYYHAAHWSERPTQRLLTLAERRLNAQAGLRGVGLATSGVRADVLLTLRLDALVHDVSRAPGELRLETEAELLDWTTQRPLARRRFSHRAPVLNAQARGAAQAANMAVTAWLDALTPWVRATLRATTPA